MTRDEDLIPQHEPVFQISIVSRMIVSESMALTPSVR